MPPQPMHHCPALLVSAPASGQGKTLVTAALARRHRDLGRKVRVFKTGPDFLDPMILERASGAPVRNLDLYMGGEEHCRALLHQAAGEADLILVEGVMGLFDGDPSAADLAVRFGLPVLGVIDGASMAQSFGAIALGLASYRSEVRLDAVLANRVGTERHAAMLEESLPSGIRWMGALPRDGGIDLPERHLGIVQAEEIEDLETRIARAASLLPAAADTLPDPVAFPAPREARPLVPLLAAKRLAVARDTAFAFIYPANIAVLEALGAQIRFFSPLKDAALPECDAVWLPGGYPELHLDALSANGAMIASLQTHHAMGKPILAECGGLLFCGESLTDKHGKRAAMAAILPGHAAMQPRLAALGMQEVELSGTLRGHTFHYSRFETDCPVLVRAMGQRGRQGEAVYRHGSLTASYLHLYFPSNPEATAALFT